MVKSDFKRFLEMMLATAEAVDRELSAAKIAVYFEDLKNFDIRALEWAAKAHRLSSPWFPKVSELRDLARTWKAPALPGNKGGETKLLESPEAREEKRQHDIAKLREIVSGFETIDRNYGTELSRKSPEFKARLDLLEQQKKVILAQEEYDGGN